MWVNANCWDYRVGQRVYIARYSPESAYQPDHIEVSDSPWHTNQSLQPRLRGWCGTNNNVAIHALGTGTIKKFNSRGDRAWVTKDAVATWLEGDAP